jgi:hypothetical protein
MVGKAFISTILAESGRLDGGVGFVVEQRLVDFAKRLVPVRTAQMLLKNINESFVFSQLLTQRYFELELHLLLISSKVIYPPSINRKRGL